MNAPRRLRPPLNTHRIYQAGFWFALLLILAVGIVSRHEVLRLQDDNRQVAHTHEVLAKMALLSSQLTDIESGSRGYLLSGDRSDLTFGSVAMRQADHTLQLIQTLTAGNAHQQVRIVQLKPLIRETISWNRQLIALRHALGRTGLPQIRLLEKDFSLMRRIRQILAEMADAEIGLLQQRREQSEASTRHVIRIMWTSIVGSLVFLLLAFFALAREVAERRRTEELVLQLNADLKRHAEDLKASNKELEAFSYSVSHDLRAPLRSIDGFSGILLEDYAGVLDAEGQRLLKAVRTGANTMGNLIDDLLKLSRLKYEELRLERTDVSAIARDIADSLQKNQPERNVQFRIAPEVTVLADRRLLRIALQNLLDNAWKFTGKRAGATIEVGVQEQTGQDLTWYVRDNGAGFDMAYANKLFGAFQRLHNSEFPGTGIGLAIVARIVHRHGGQIWAQGAVDQGATFFVKLATPESAAAGAVAQVAEA